MKHRVLVIDDDPMIRDVFMLALRHAGYEAFAAPDGPSGVAAASQVAPSLILMDMDMPGLNGCETFRRLGGELGSALPAVLLVTAREISPDAVLREGFSGYLRKPVDFLILVEAVARCLTGVPDASCSSNGSGIVAPQPG